MISKINYQKGIEMVKASMLEKEPYEINICDKKFIVYPNVFSPKYFQDSSFFAEMLPINEGESFLEIGSGTGVISIIAAYRGASRIVATDINPTAVANTKENVSRHGFSDKIIVLEGDLYGPFAEGQRFDTICWNFPFGDPAGYSQKRETSMLERSLFDPNYGSFRKFVQESRIYLNENGRLLIGFSKSIGDYDKFVRILENNRFRFKVVASTIRERGLANIPASFELYEAKPY